MTGVDRGGFFKRPFPNRKSKFLSKIAKSRFLRCSRKDVCIYKDSIPSGSEIKAHLHETHTFGILKVPKKKFLKFRDFANYVES